MLGKLRAISAGVEDGNIPDDDEFYCSILARF